VQATSLILVLMLGFTLLASAYSDVTLDIDKEIPCTSDGACQTYLYVYRNDISSTAWINVTHSATREKPWTFEIEVYNVKNLSVDVEALYNAWRSEIFADTSTNYWAWLQKRETVTVRTSVTSEVENVTLIDVPEPIKVRVNGNEIGWEYGTDLTIRSSYPDEGTLTFEIIFNPGTNGFHNNPFGNSPTAPVALFLLITAGVFVIIAVVLTVAEKLRKQRKRPRRRRR
jgi:hypothetical protein